MICSIHRDTAFVALFFFCFAATLSLPLKAQSLKWAGCTTETGTVPSSCQTCCMTVDGAGAIYTTGVFRGTVDFDPRPGVYELTAAIEDIFIQKLDAAGNLVWARRIVGIANDIGRAISADSFGNIYVAGIFSDTVDFDPGPGVFKLSSMTYQSDIFILKLDTSGNFIWAKSIGGSDADYAQGLTVDQAGNVYVTGTFGGTVDFDPNIGVYNLSGAGYSAFVLKLDATGNFVFARNIARSSSTAGGAVGFAITLDKDKNILTLGWFAHMLDFDPGTDTFNMTPTVPANHDVFVSKLDSLGNFVWARHIGGAPAAIIGTSIATDRNGNVIICGGFGNTIDIDPGPAVNYIMSSAGIDFNGFIVKLDSSGSFVWGTDIGGFLDARATSINVDKAGNVYYTGKFAGSADFDPGPGTFFMTSSSLLAPPLISDYFVVKLDSNYNFVSAFQSIGSTNIITTNTAIDRNGHLILAGNVTGLYDCDPGPGTYFVATAGHQSSFVAKYCIGDCMPDLGLESSTGSESPFLIAPNPTSGTFKIHSSNGFDNAQLIITDITGAVIDKIVVRNNGEYLLPPDLPDGVYLVHLIGANCTATSKVVLMR